MLLVESVGKHVRLLTARRCEMDNDVAFQLDQLPAFCIGMSGAQRKRWIKFKNLVLASTYVMTGAKHV